MGGTITQFLSILKIGELLGVSVILNYETCFAYRIALVSSFCPVKISAQSAAKSVKREKARNSFLKQLILGSAAL